jgi:hypothetical protein
MCFYHLSNYVVDCMKRTYEILKKCEWLFLSELCVEGIQGVGQFI